MRFSALSLVLLLAVSAVTVLAKSGSGIVVATLATETADDRPAPSATYFCLPLGSPTEDFTLDLELQCGSSESACQGPISLSWPWGDHKPFSLPPSIITSHLRTATGNHLGFEDSYLRSKGVLIGRLSLPNADLGRVSASFSFSQGEFSTTQDAVAFCSNFTAPEHFGRSDDDEHKDEQDHRHGSDRDFHTCFLAFPLHFLLLLLGAFVLGLLIGCCHCCTCCCCCRKSKTSKYHQLESVEVAPSTPTPTPQVVYLVSSPRPVVASAYQAL